MGHRIGSLIGEVKETNVFETKDWELFLKILVTINVKNPLKTGINVGIKKDGVCWVDFQYERLAQFCYSCGLIGNDEDLCGKKSKQLLMKIQGRER
ncbi:Zinc knuckle CX2CX4HX4C [Sesbania bispinosa]|nr:Zinc knuckle CX2CX4HX4C [Sesbania bispinosa]